jgi:hypothetical protein
MQNVNRLASLVLVFALNAPAAANAVAANPAAPLPAVAPADTYFGPFGMSPLSIRSTIGLLGREYHARTISDHDLLRKALLTEDALRIWRQRYPRDPWLAPTFYHLEQLYQAVQTAEARKHATAILRDIVLHYPSTKEGHLSRARLAAGFPPLVAESPLVQTPAPNAPATDPAVVPASSTSAPPTSAPSPNPSPGK